MRHLLIWLFKRGFFFTNKFKLVTSTNNILSHHTFAFSSAYKYYLKFSSHLCVYFSSCPLDKENMKIWNYLKPTQLDFPSWVLNLNLEGRPSQSMFLPWVLCLSWRSGSCSQIMLFLDSLEFLWQEKNIPSKMSIPSPCN